MQDARTLDMSEILLSCVGQFLSDTHHIQLLARVQTLVARGVCVCSCL